MTNRKLLITLTFLCAFALPAESNDFRHHFLRAEFNLAAAALERTPTADLATQKAYEALNHCSSDEDESIRPGVEAARSAVKLNPRSSIAHAALGSCLRQQLQHVDSRRAIDAALAYAPGDPFIQAISARVIANEGYRLEDLALQQKAHSLVQSAVEKNQTSAYIWQAKCTALRFLKRYSEGVVACSQAIALNSKYASAYLERAICRNRLKQSDLARQDVEVAIQLTPKSFRSRYQLALLDKERNELTAASDGFQEVLRTNPKHALSHAMLAEILWTQNSLDRGLEHAVRAEELHSVLAKTQRLRNLFTTSGILLAKEMAQAAQVPADKMVQLDPAYSDSWYARGRARAGQGKLMAAIADYNKALEIDPDYENILRDRAEAYHLLGKDAEAQADPTRLPKREGSDAVIEAIWNAFGILPATLACVESRSPGTYIEYPEYDPYGYGRKRAEIEAQRRHDRQVAECNNSMRLRFQSFPEIISKLGPAGSQRAVRVGKIRKIMTEGPYFVLFAEYEATQGRLR